MDRLNAQCWTLYVQKRLMASSNLPHIMGYIRHFDVLAKSYHLATIWCTSLLCWFCSPFAYDLSTLIVILCTESGGHFVFSDVAS